MKKITILFLFSVFMVKSFCGEGMWIPLLIDSLNYNDMLSKGLRLTAEEIYSINHKSLKDAVVIFGNGCTGELISAEGLLITNHHCGYSRIQAHSTVDKNYLADGFWAASKAEELPNPGLTVTFLVRMEDVSDRILEGLSDSIAEQDRNSLISSRIHYIRQEAIQNTHYQAEIKPFFFGSAYYLFVYEIYTDVRLVGTPPEAIGRFGGDTDNWIWPRHTGDFSMFRIYAGKDNLPADYSPENVPYQPRKYLPISAKGVKEGDYTMVIGYPGRTDQFLTSEGLSLIAKNSLPAKIEMRTLKLNTLQEIMARSPEQKLRYSSRYVGISNAWKKWIGVTKGVETSGVMERKRLLEEEFNRWANSPANKTGEYGTLMQEFSNVYNQYAPAYLANDLTSELLNSLEVSNLLNRTQTRYYGSSDSSTAYKKQVLAEIKQQGTHFFKTSGVEIDRKTLPVLLKIYSDYTVNGFHPAVYGQIERDYQGNFQAFVSDIFNKSVFTDSVRFLKMLQKSGKIAKTLQQDPLVAMYRDFYLQLMSKDYARIDSLNQELNRLYRKYVSGLQLLYPGRTFYPDANFTMRVAYGKVEGYKPADAVDFIFQSTIDGIFEKKDTAIEDYRVPERLEDLYKTGNYGNWAKDGKLPVCFIASNHTSGGNSGSPVMNANGELIGINFDRNWEGTVSDFAYDPAVCRNISLDIRYVLFIIDKLAGAGWLLNELTIVN